MLLQFSFSNFRSFRELQTLNFVAGNRDKSLPENCITPVLPGLTGKLSRWTKGAALYGANASGKSTVLQALRALRNLVLTSARTTDPTEPIAQIVPFALDPAAATEPTAFAISFIQDGMRYEYRVAATRERIRHESLRSFPTAQPVEWFTRDWSEETGAFVFGPEKPKTFARDRPVEQRTLPNALHLSKLVAENHQQAAPVFRWFKERLHFFDLSAEGGFGGGFTTREFAEKTTNTSRMLELLRNADIGVASALVIEEEESFPDSNAFQPVASRPMTESGALLKALSEPHQPQSLSGGEPESPKKRKMFRVELAHKGKAGKLQLFDWADESAGTRRLYSLAGPWLDILQKGRIVCIDELETSMHPLMVRELLRLFFSEKENHNRAQILFTTHNPLLLDPTLIRRDQIWFTDKDNEGAAHLYPLTDYDPRQGESLVRGYMSGRYGAVPFIPAGLLDGTFEATGDGDAVETENKEPA